MRSVQSTRLKPVLVLAALVAVVGSAGCAGDSVEPFEQITDPGRLYMRLALDYRAVNLSTVPAYSTFQLTATPLDANGAPMTDVPAPTFRSTDTTKVRVSPAGLLTAVAAGTGISIIAEMTMSNNVRHADTTIVNVNATTDPPPTLTSLSIDPVAPDSAIVPIDLGNVDFVIDFQWLTPSLKKMPFSLQPRTRARGPAGEGDAILGLTVEYVSLDPDVAAVHRQTGRILGLRPGSARFEARTWAYGVYKADTTVFTVTTPFVRAYVLSPATGFQQLRPAITIRPYGLVFWTNQLNQPLDIVFDDPAAVAQPPAILCDVIQSPTTFLNAPDACGTGNFQVPSTGPPPIAQPYLHTRVRQFPVPGTYTYRETVSGTVGKIVVTDGTTP